MIVGSVADERKPWTIIYRQKERPENVQNFEYHKLKSGGEQTEKGDRARGK